MLIWQGTHTYQGHPTGQILTTLQYAWKRNICIYTSCSHIYWKVFLTATPNSCNKLGCLWYYISPAKQGRMLVFLIRLTRPVGRGGSRGFARTPLLASIRFYIHGLTVHFKCPTIWNWFTSLAAIENHSRSNECGCSYSSLFMEDQRGTRA